MDQRLYDAVTANPIIAAAKDEEGLERCCELEEVQIVFILFGNISNIHEFVTRIHQVGKIAMVHMDLIDGLSSRPVSVDFIKKNTVADGIITTKPALIKRGKELSLFTILRFFVIDSIALSNIQKVDRQYPYSRPDFIEVLPGVMPKIIKQIVRNSKTPLIASGMIIDKEDVVQALKAGATAISTTNQSVWEL